jgi:hypothetical protein
MSSWWLPGVERGPVAPGKQSKAIPLAIVDGKNGWKILDGKTFGPGYCEKKHLV